MRLQDKVCLITGAGSGIGRATAELFAREGATILATDVDEAAALKTAADVAGRGWRLDVTDQASCESVVAEAIRQTGRIDVLFNNAGIAGVGRLHETSLELWERVMAVNVRGVFLASRAVLPHMIEQRSGSIVNMSSCIAEIGLAERASYGASKGAVLALTRCMQADYAQFGIRVNALLPGTIHTPFVDRYLKESYADPQVGLETIKKRQLLGELGRAEDVAYAALYLASDESRFVLATAMYVDGGVRGAK
ncbi:MAG: SDR family oxidoreductase [Chloroflexi bacterium]|nr:MAG: SDR family oxidoreductase [Chloroflexota bacterium]TME17943.1 MAG: SDR family oxidoreductase [Chloroflexota bacterium]